MPTTTPVTTPTTTPTTNPDATPWHERFTDPARICPAQTQETASPDIPV